LVLPLKQDSLVQRFSFDFPAKIRQQDNEEQIDYQDVIEFICLVAITCTLPVKRMKAGISNKRKFIVQIMPGNLSCIGS